MKAKVMWLALGLCGVAAAQEVFTNDIDMRGYAVRNVGLQEISSNNLAWPAAVPSLGQLAGVNTNYDNLPSSYLVPLRPAYLETDGIYARTSNGLTFYSATGVPLLQFQNGVMIGGGDGLSNLNAAALTSGRLSVSALPTGGVWLATGVTISNAVFQGNGSNLVGLTAAQVGVNYYAVTDSDTAVGNTANGATYGAALGFDALGYYYGAAVGCDAYANFAGAAIGRHADGHLYGAAVGWSSDGSDAGVAVGCGAWGKHYGAAVGQAAKGHSNGVAVGAYARAFGLGNVAIGGTTEGGLAATVPTNWVDTVELGRGAATLPGGLNFRGQGIVNSNGVVIAAISTTNLVATFVPLQNELGMGSFTNSP